MTSSFHIVGQWAESSTTLCLEGGRRVATPDGRQTTTVFGRVDQNATPGAKAACKTVGLVRTVYIG